jgi:hypothetical protein
MAFAASGLAYLVGANNAGPRIWSYKTADAKATVDTSGYFNNASTDLNVGDFIFANASDGYGVFVVVSNSNGVVDVGDMVSFQSADTD